MQYISRYSKEIALKEAYQVAFSTQFDEFMNISPLQINTASMLDSKLESFLQGYKIAFSGTYDSHFT